MRVTIGETVRIEQPSNDIRNWCNHHLILPNPEFDKKAAMGLWLGNTPETLTLYEKQGSVWELPFGTIRQILPMCEKVTSSFQPPTRVRYGGQPVPLYDYQEDAVEMLYKCKYGILQSAAGSGKTQMGIALVKKWGVTALWLTHTQDLLRQSMDRARLYMDPGVMGVITGGKVNIGTGITFATIQTMSKLDLSRYRDLWDVVICDECFPAGTAVETEAGPRAIENLGGGDRVLTLNENGNTVLKPITHLFKRIPHSMVTIRLKNGKTLNCTDNHPILTQRGYVKAGEINDSDCVRCMREDLRSDESERDTAMLHQAWRKITALLKRMCKGGPKKTQRLDSGAQGDIGQDNGRNEPQICLGENGREQSDALQRRADQGFGKAPGDRSQAAYTWRKRKRPDRTSADPRRIADTAWSNAGNRVCGANAQASGRIPDTLQDRHRNPGQNDCHRSGWTLSHKPARTDGRQEEGRLLEWVGVDSVQVHEPGCDDGYGSLCPDGYVYNLEVEGNHNYFANGINVHNCHHVSGSPTTVTMYYRVLNNLRARHKYGLSATVHRADGLVAATHAMLGETVWKVPDTAVADRIMKARIRPVSTGTPLSDECLKPDGTLNYTGMITYLSENEDRNALIRDCIRQEKGRSCLILSDRLEHLNTLMYSLPEDMLDDAVMVTGRMVSKTGRAEREAALDLMRSGEKKYLFASYALAKEGLDIPNLERLFMATPVKDEAVVIQAVGRVCRTSPGKETPIVYDFVDSIRYCQKAYRERMRHYRKIDAECEE